MNDTEESKASSTSSGHGSNYGSTGQTRKNTFVSREVFFADGRHIPRGTTNENLYHLSGVVDDLLAVINAFPKHEAGKSKALKRIEKRFKNAQSSDPNNDQETFYFFDKQGDPVREQEWVINTGNVKRDAAIRACFRVYCALNVLINGVCGKKAEIEDREKTVEPFKKLLEDNRAYLSEQNYRVKYYSDFLGEGSISNQLPGYYEPRVNHNREEELVRTTTGYQKRSCKQNTVRGVSIVGGSSAASFGTYLTTATFTQTEAAASAWIIRGVSSSLVFFLSVGCLWFFTRHCCITPVTEYEYLEQENDDFDFRDGTVSLINDEEEDDAKSVASNKNTNKVSNPYSAILPLNDEVSTESADLSASDNDGSNDSVETVDLDGADSATGITQLVQQANNVNKALRELAQALGGNDYGRQKNANDIDALIADIANTAKIDLQTVGVIPQPAAIPSGYVSLSSGLGGNGSD